MQNKHYPSNRGETTAMVDTLVEHLKFEEGFESTPYRCTAGALTIGYGRNLDAVGLRPGEDQYICGGVVPDNIEDYVVTEEGAEAMLMNDIEAAVASVDRRMPWADRLHQNAFIALVAMRFQMGSGALGRFKNMLASLEAHDYSEAAVHALDSKWARSDTPARAKRVAAMLQNHSR